MTSAWNHQETCLQGDRRHTVRGSQKVYNKNFLNRKTKHRILLSLKSITISNARSIFSYRPDLGLRI